MWLKSDKASVGFLLSLVLPVGVLIFNSVVDDMNNMIMFFLER